MDAANLLPASSGRLVFDPHPGGSTWCLAAAPLASPPPKTARATCYFRYDDATTMVANTVELHPLPPPTTTVSLTGRDPFPDINHQTELTHAGDVHHVRL